MANTVTEYVSIQNITVPANTASSSPQKTSVDLGWCLLDKVYLRIPPGPQGLAGWALEVSGTRIIPWQQSDAWILGDNEVFQELLGLQLDTGLEIVTYNSDDTYDHTFYARLTYTPIALVTGGPVVQTPAAIG